MRDMVYAAEGGVPVPTLDLPPWLWIGVIVLFIAFAVLLGREAVRSGRIALMVVSIGLGIVIGAAILSMAYTSMLRGQSIKALDELAEKYDVWIHPQRGGLFAAPVVKNSSADVIIKNRAGQAFDCTVVGDDETYSVYCVKDGNLLPIESVIGG